MATSYEIPLTPEAQTFVIALGGVNYKLTFRWCDPVACWMLDIADGAGVAICSGLALVTGTDILGQFAYLGIAGQLIVQSFGKIDAIPGYADLGVHSALFFVPA